MRLFNKKTSPETTSDNTQSFQDIVVSEEVKQEDQFGNLDIKTLVSQSAIQETDLKFKEVDEIAMQIAKEGMMSTIEQLCKLVKENINITEESISFLKNTNTASNYSEIENNIDIARTSINSSLNDDPSEKEKQEEKIENLAKDLKKTNEETKEPLKLPEKPYQSNANQDNFDIFLSKIKEAITALSENNETKKCLKEAILENLLNILKYVIDELRSISKEAYVFITQYRQPVSKETIKALQKLIEMLINIITMIVKDPDLNIDQDSIKEFIKYCRQQCNESTQINLQTELINTMNIQDETRKESSKIKKATENMKRAMQASRGILEASRANQDAIEDTNTEEDNS